MCFFRKCTVTKKAIKNWLRMERRKKKRKRNDANRALRLKISFFYPPSYLGNSSDEHIFKNKV